MVSLVDIVPQRRTVQISAGALELRGLGLRQIADLLVRFPELRKLFVEGAPALDSDQLLADAPDAIGAIVAQAADQPDAAAAIANALSLEDLAECLVVIRDLTMPNGVAPLFDRLTALVGGGGAQPGRAPVTSVQQPPNSLLQTDMTPPP
jgi:hypothetical protein